MIFKGEDMWKDGSSRAKPWIAEVTRGVGGEHYTIIVSQEGEIVAKIERPNEEDASTSFDGAFFGTFHTHAQKEIIHAPGGYFEAHVWSGQNGFYSAPLTDENDAEEVAQELLDFIKDINWAR